MSQLTIEKIKASTSISTRIKKLLESLVPQDEKPPQLTKWAREVFDVMRKEGHSDNDIAKYITAYARGRCYSDQQISNVLRMNHYHRYNTSTSSGNPLMDFTPQHNIKTLTQLVEGLSGLKLNDVIQIDSPTKIAEMAESNLREVAARNSPAELLSYSQLLENSIPLLKRLQTIIDARLKASNTLER